jgi:hypothetical protein
MVIAAVTATGTVLRLKQNYKSLNNNFLIKFFLIFLQSFQ